MHVHTSILVCKFVFKMLRLEIMGCQVKDLLTLALSQGSKM